MKRTQKISTKIKILSSVVMILVFFNIISTIFLNERTSKDALIINVVGKQRMLTQKIAKNVFYLYESNTTNFTELDNAIQEFTYALDSLRNGNKLLGIEPTSNKLIANQFYVIDVLWNNYVQNVQQFKREMIYDKNTHSKPVQHYINAIHEINPNLLHEVDRLVNFYTLDAERKTSYLKYFQYAAAFILLLVFIYVFIKLREIKEHTQVFLDSIKKLTTHEGEITKLIPIQTTQEEEEIVELSDSINTFINKVNQAMQSSTDAIIHSKNAASKLEEITEEFDQIIDNLKDNSNISEQINKSEDMIIESTEDLINSTKRLEELKDKLQQLKKLSVDESN